MGTKKILQLPAIFIFVSGATFITTMWHFASSKKMNKIMGLGYQPSRRPKKLPV